MTSKAHLVIDAADIAAPLAAIALQQHLRRSSAPRHDLAQRIEEAAFIVAGAVEAGAGVEAGFGDGEHSLAEVAKALAGRRAGGEAELRHLVAKPLPLVQRPALDLVPGGIERPLVVKQADPERGQG